MKILQIISSGGMYGAESVILDLCRGLDKGGNCGEIAVFANSSAPNLDLRDAALREGIKCHVIPCRGQVDRKAVQMIRDLVTSDGFDVVHAHGYKPDIYSYAALCQAGIPMVSTCHTWYDNDPLVYLYGVLDRFVLRSYDRVVAVSEEVRRRLLKAGVQTDKSVLIPNGIEMQSFSNAMPSLRPGAGDFKGILIGLVGRLAKEKGIDIYLRAVTQVLRAFPETAFVVVGEGPDRDNLQKLTDELGIGRSVSLLGRRSDMPSVYASLDLLVSSSRQEGLPIAILEGMASGLPIIATAVGEVPAVIEDGVSGILIPKEDPDALAEAIISLLRDDEKRRRLASGARRRARDKYSAARMTVDYLHIYESVVGTAAMVH